MHLDQEEWPIALEDSAHSGQHLRLGALDFVEKPVSLDRLLLTLRNALRLDRAAFSPKLVAYFDQVRRASS